MAKYYFDIETYSVGEKIDPSKDKIISIQFQELNDKTGEAKGPLNIYKEWETSEEAIVRKFFPKFRAWEFIPVGNNLAFERMFLKEKFEKFLGREITHKYLDYYMPSIDLQPVLVIMNKGQFKGSGLHFFSEKKYSGEKIKEWYEAKDFESIENYIKMEARAFIKLYAKLVKELPKIFPRKKALES